MEELEREFDEPTGITTVKAPELALEGVLLSQNCGILHEVKHAIRVQYVLLSITLSRFFSDPIGRTQKLTMRLLALCSRLG